MEEGRKNIFSCTSLIFLEVPQRHGVEAFYTSLDTSLDISYTPHD